MFDIRQVDLRKINSMTKYPSIPTYHTLGQKGMLTEEVQVSFEGQNVLGTEKIDGTNTRIILCPDGSIIVGSREELLWAVGDLIRNATLGVVDAVAPIAQKIQCYCSPPANVILVFYMETYGKGIQKAAKNYTKTGKVGSRLFDVAKIDIHHLDKSCEEISRWRENKGQCFLEYEKIENWAKDLGIDSVPFLFGGDGTIIPTGLRKTLAFVRQFEETKAALDDDAYMCAEGIVVRTPNRRLIAKIRHLDYARTIRQLGLGWIHTPSEYEEDEE